jgi:hypothetical protein
VSTYAVRGIGEAVPTENTNIIREYELKKKSEKNTNIYNEKQNNARNAEVLFQYEVARPTVTNEVYYVHEIVNQLTVSGRYVKHIQNV